MEHDIKEIKMLRKKLEITQNELAKKSGVSQSLVAKIESNSIDPAYSSVQKIFAALKELSENRSLKAKDIMQRKVITADTQTTVSEAIRIMKKHKISQIPVLKNDVPVGVVSESTIINSLMNDSRSEYVKDNMDPAPPILSRDTNIEAVSNLLKFFQMVIVMDDTTIAGIITKADILEKLYR